jgi:hypothetical protein
MAPMWAAPAGSQRNTNCLYKQYVGIPCRNNSTQCHHWQARCHLPPILETQPERFQNVPSRTAGHSCYVLPALHVRALLGCHHPLSGSEVTWHDVMHKGQKGRRWSRSRPVMSIIFSIMFTMMFTREHDGQSCVILAIIHLRQRSNGCRSRGPG